MFYARLRHGGSWRAGALPHLELTVSTAGAVVGLVAGAFGLGGPRGGLQAVCGVAATGPVVTALVGRRNALLREPSRRRGAASWSAPGWAGGRDCRSESRT